jgi:hypothetical protein
MLRQQQKQRRRYSGTGQQQRRLGLYCLVTAVHLQQQGLLLLLGLIQTAVEPRVVLLQVNPKIGCGG